MPHVLAQASSTKTRLYLLEHFFLIFLILPFLTQLHFLDFPLDLKITSFESVQDGLIGAAVGSTGADVGETGDCVGDVVDEFDGTSDGAELFVGPSLGAELGK